MWALMPARLDAPHRVAQQLEPLLAADVGGALGRPSVEGDGDGVHPRGQRRQRLIAHAGAVGDDGHGADAGFLRPLQQLGQVGPQKRFAARDGEHVHAAFRQFVYGAQHGVCGRILAIVAGIVFRVASGAAEVAALGDMQVGQSQRRRFPRFGEKLAVDQPLGQRRIDAMGLLLGHVVLEKPLAQLGPFGSEARHRPVVQVSHGGNAAQVECDHVASKAHGSPSVSVKARRVERRKDARGALSVSFACCPSRPF